MQTKHLCVLIHIWTKGEVGAPLNRFKPSVIRRCFICGSFMLFLSCFVMLHARLFVDALWSPAGKGLASWLSFLMSNYDVVTFPLVSWVRCGVWLYRFLIFVFFLTLSLRCTSVCKGGTIPFDAYKQNLCISYQILQMQYILEEVIINGFHEG